EVDSDPWRTQVRVAQADPNTLKRLADSPESLAQPPTSLCLLGDYLHRQGEVEAAATLLAKAQRKYPDDFWVNHNVGLHMMYCRPSRWEESVRYFSVAVALRPQSPGARLKLGWALERARRFDEAIATYQAAIQVKPDNVLARFCLGHLFLSEKQDYDGA